MISSIILQLEKMYWDCTHVQWSLKVWDHTENLELLNILKRKCATSWLFNNQDVQFVGHEFVGSGFVGQKVRFSMSLSQSMEVRWCSVGYDLTWIIRFCTNLSSLSVHVHDVIKATKGTYQANSGALNYHSLCSQPPMTSRRWFLPTPESQRYIDHWYCSNNDRKLNMFCLDDIWSCWCNSKELLIWKMLFPWHVEDRS